MSGVSDLFEPLLSRRDHVDEREANAVIPATISEVTEILSNARRRWIITDVTENGATTLSDMADRRSHYVYGPEYTCGQRKREYVTFYQVHLPALDHAGAVQYRQRGGGNKVEPGEHLAGYAAALETLTELCLDPEPYVPDDDGGDA